MYQFPDSGDRELVNSVLVALQSLGAKVGQVQEFTQAPNTDLSSQALRVLCHLNQLQFEIIMSGWSGDLTLESELMLFDDVSTREFGDSSDLDVRQVIDWLIKNAPTKIALQRSYGRHDSDAQPFEMPYWPTREPVGGSVHLYVPLFEDARDASTSPYVYVKTQGLSVPVGEYFYTKHFIDTPVVTLPDVLPIVISFMENAQRSGQLPRGAVWRAANQHLDEEPE
jgi:hypothetical protein